MGERMNGKTDKLKGMSVRGLDEWMDRWVNGLNGWCMGGCENLNVCIKTLTIGKDMKRIK